MSTTINETQRPVSPLRVRVQPPLTHTGEKAASHVTSEKASTPFQDPALPPGVKIDPKIEKMSENKFEDVPFSRPFSPKQPSGMETVQSGNGLHTPTLIPESATSAVLGTREAGHARRWIKVPKGWFAKKGAEVVDGLRVGDTLGKGCQGGVYKLEDKDGNVDETRVLKAKHKHALLVKMKREWEIGRCIANLYEPDSALPGYMATGEGVVTENGNFIGMILEKINGKQPSKRLKDSSFNDVHYVEELLFCVFNALDIGQKSLGFHHADLRVSNVMELKTKSAAGAPALEESDVAGRAAALSFNGENVGRNAAERLNQFKIIDYGLADFTEYYPSGRVDVGGPTHAVPKTGPLHFSIGQLQMSLPMPLTLEQLKGIPKINPLDRMYRYFWRNKGDIYHVCWDLTRYLDGRVWPEEDERQVKLLFAFIHHVTGVRLKAWFAPTSSVDKDGKLTIPRRLRTFGFVQHYDGCLHVLRIRAIRLQAWFRPHNPGVTAAEALCAPFFEACLHKGEEQV